MGAATETVLRGSDERAAGRAGTVVVVDRRPLVRFGLAGLAREALGGDHGAADASLPLPLPDLDIAAVSVHNPPARIVLLGLADGDDPTALVQRARELDAPVICVLCCSDPRAFADAVSARADGYLLGDLLDAETLRDAVANVEAGERPLPLELTVCRSRRGHEPLTARCREVLALAARGLHDNEIADALGISANSIHRHIREARHRLDARTRPEAVAKAIRASLL